MNIVIEGPDNSGKSTLVDVLAKHLNWNVAHSDGPLPNAEALNDRVRAFLQRDNTIFDRHTAISERVYGAARGRNMLDPTLEQMFYSSPLIIVYCKGDGTLGEHRLKPHDTEKHVAFVKQQHGLICAFYDEWGLQRAHILYRKGESPMQVLRFIQGAIHR